MGALSPWVELTTGTAEFTQSVCRVGAAQMSAVQDLHFRLFMFPREESSASVQS